MKKITIAALLLLIPFCVCNAENYEMIEEDYLAAYEQLLQMALDYEPLEPYFYLNDDGAYYPVIIDDGEMNWKLPRTNVKKFGMPVRFINRMQADTSEFKAYFMVADFILLDSTARIQLYDTQRKILFGASFNKGAKDEWIISSSIIMTENGSGIPEKFIILGRLIKECIDNNADFGLSLNTAANDTLNQIIFVYNEIMKYKWQPKITYRGARIKFMHSGDVDANELKAYYNIIDFIYLNNSARLVIDDPINKLSFRFHFNMIKGKWHIVSSHEEHY